MKNNSKCTKVHDNETRYVDLTFYGYDVKLMLNFEAESCKVPNQKKFSDVLQDFSGDQGQEDE